MQRKNVIAAAALVLGALVAFMPQRAKTETVAACDIDDKKILRHMHALAPLYDDASAAMGDYYGLVLLAYEICERGGGQKIDEYMQRFIKLVPKTGAPSRASKTLDSLMDSIRAEQARADLTKRIQAEMTEELRPRTAAEMHKITEDARKAVDERVEWCNKNTDSSFADLCTRWRERQLKSK